MPFVYVEQLAAVPAIDEREMEFVAPGLLNSVGAFHPVGLGHAWSLSMEEGPSRPFLVESGGGGFRSTKFEWSGHIRASLKIGRGSYASAAPRCRIPSTEN